MFSSTITIREKSGEELEFLIDEILEDLEQNQDMFIDNHSCREGIFVFTICYDMAEALTDTVSSLAYALVRLGIYDFELSILELV